MKYLAGYPETLLEQVRSLLDEGKLKALLEKKYPEQHQIRSDKALYDYTMAIKNQFLRKAQNLSKVCFDSKISIRQQALGLHSYVSRVQGKKLKAKNELRVASVLRKAPEAFLRMIVVHELAHLKEKDHNKPFYKLCVHMEPRYYEYELDMRIYLTLLEETGQGLHGEA